MLKLGDYVKIKNNNMNGNIIRIMKKDNILEYLIKLDNNILVTYNEENLTKIDSSLKNKNRYMKYEGNKNISINLNTDKNFSPEIMLRHQTLEEALNNLEYFIDKAMANNVKEIRIIHGRSGGILRKGVHEFLKNNPYIADYRLGYYYEGSYGVTVARLK